MSDTVLTAMIGVAGSVVGAVATVIVARIQTAQKVAHAGVTERGELQQGLGRLVDIRELRILRALFGEPNGRILDGYLTEYYRASLHAVLEKKWVKQIESRYYMTPEGMRICREYLRELAGWQPAAQLLG
jgi:hypothetical protein